MENSNLATINLKSYAKINLRLKIVGRNNSDYHLIELITAILNLSDDIALTPNLKDFDEITELKFSTNIYPFILNSKENSLTKALKLIREKVKVDTFYDITINKNIPAGGGLGGGSSNAATLIKYFSKLHRKNPYELFSKKEINNIGTDIHCFLDSSNLIFQENIGDEVSSLKINENSKLNKALLFFPKILSSSPLMYSKFKELGEFSQKQFVKSELNDHELIKLIDNDFLNIFLKLNPEIKDFYNSINDLNLGVFSLSGSGSTFFLLPNTNLSPENYHDINNISQKFSVKFIETKLNIINI